MKQTINTYQFRDAFRDMGRKDQFTYEGLAALFEYLAEYEESTGEQIELDVIALCCEYSEYDSALECAKEYNAAIEENKDFDAEDKENAALAWLQDQTQVIPVLDTGRIIILDF